MHPNPPGPRRCPAPTRPACRRPHQPRHHARRLARHRRRSRRCPDRTGLRRHRGIPGIGTAETPLRGPHPPRPLSSARHGGRRHGHRRPITDLAATLAVSERQLRNLFTAGIGVSSQHYARITRIRQVLATAGNTPWSHLAAAGGFYDQSHLTADFRSLMGVPPTAYFRGDIPAPTPCQSLIRIPNRP
ncbi:helix-turn-helix domain-containing protein [Nocardia seriolae]|uniref:helix-turn-helix domain-containing protein n=1 Tax=Nocardia seriolae TaxID=37332 RepID=UPI0018D5A82D|nr:AraC family transcriptional regulator [Nocardia seriolae]